MFYASLSRMQRETALPDYRNKHRKNNTEKVEVEQVRNQLTLQSVMDIEYISK